MSVPYIPVVSHTIMLNFIAKFLCCFESCFSRKFSFRWFVTIFRASSWSLDASAAAGYPWLYVSHGILAVIPLSIGLPGRLEAARNWKNASIFCASHVVQMVEDAYRAAEIFLDCLLLLDQYFFSAPALERLKALNNAGKS